MFLELFHGRRDPAADLEDWGDQGPIFECVQVHVTYLNTVRLVDVKGPEGVIFTEQWLEAYEDMIYYDDVFYGDFNILSAVSDPQHSFDAERTRVVPIKPILAKLPERYQELQNQFLVEKHLRQQGQDAQQIQGALRKLQNGKAQVEQLLSLYQLRWKVPYDDSSIS